MSVLTQQMVRHGTAIRAGVVGALAVIMLLAGSIPLFGRARELSQKIDIRQKEARDIANRVAVLSGLDREVLRERMEIIDTALPPKKDVLLYLSAVDGLSRELGLTFSGISLSPGEVTEASESAAPTNKRNATAEAVPGVHSLETEVKINGNRDSIYAFLRLVEQSLPLMQVKDVSVTASGLENYILTVRLGMLWASGDPTQVKGAITLFNEKEENYFQQLSSYRQFTPVFLETTTAVTSGKGDLFAPAAVPVTIDLVEPVAATDTPTLQ